MKGPETPGRHRYRLVAVRPGGTRIKSCSLTGSRGTSNAGSKCLPGPRYHCRIKRASHVCSPASRMQLIPGPHSSPHYSSIDQASLPIILSLHLPRSPKLWRRTIPGPTSHASSTSSVGRFSYSVCFLPPSSPLSCIFHWKPVPPRALLALSPPTWRSQSPCPRGAFHGASTHATNLQS